MFVQTLQTLALAVRLLLELGLLAALGVWAWRTVRHPVPRVAATVALPLAAATAWGSFVHGELIGSVTGVVAQVVLFAAASAALVAVRHPRIAAAFAGTVVVNVGVLAVLGA
jgi:Protein of unknown function (DUF2568)